MWANEAEPNSNIHFGQEFITWSNNNNFGIVKIIDAEKNYTRLFWLIFPELAILLSVLMNI